MARRVIQFLGMRGSARPQAWVAMVLAAWSVVILAAPAVADDRLAAEAERRNRRANSMYQQGRYEEALQMYQSAYDLYLQPKYLFNIGLAREKTFDYEGCALAFREFLRQHNESGAEQSSGVAVAARTRLDGCLSKTQIPVQFTSVPTNAAIMLAEGERSVQRGRTPQLLKLPPGEHHLVVSLPGYVEQAQTIRVDIGDRQQVDFVLEKLSSLHIEVDPSGAQVRIGDSEWEAAPVTRQVRAGVFEVEVRKPGYEPNRREVNVEAGREVSLVLSLRPKPTIRTLKIRAHGYYGEVPPQVTIDGNQVGAAPVTARLPPGEHRMTVTAPGRIPFEDSITVPQERDLNLLVTLTSVRSRRQRIALWGLGGSAGAAAVVGASYGVLALLDQQSFNEDQSNFELHDRGERRAVRADVWLGTAAVLGAGTVLYYYLTRPEPSSVVAN